MRSNQVRIFFSSVGPVGKQEIIDLYVSEKYIYICLMLGFIYKKIQFK